MNVWCRKTLLNQHLKTGYFLIVSVTVAYWLVRYQEMKRPDF